MLRSRPKLSPCGWQVVVALFWVGLALAWASTDASGRVPSARVAKRMTPGLRRVVMRGFSSARDAVVERDGGVLVATDRGIVRLRADGSLDRSFGRAGLLRVRAGGREMGAAVLALDRDHFLVAGIPSGTKGVIGVLRYTRRGRLDRRFGSAGLAAVRPPTVAGVDPRVHPSSPEVNGLAALAGGRIVVGGTVSSFDDASLHDVSDFWLARVTPAGALDSSFGAGGTVRTDVATRDLQARLFLQPDGRMVLSGLSAACGPDAGEECGRVGCGQDVDCTAVLLRYLSDGSPDPTFGPAGSGISRFASDFDSPVLVPGRSGQFVVFAGREVTRHGVGAHRPILVRLTRDGQLAHAPTILDRRFDDVHPAGALRQRDGKLILLASDGITLARFTSSLRLDDRFGRHGVVRITTSDTSTTLIRGAGGRLFIIGSDTNSRLVVRRVA